MGLPMAVFCGYLSDLCLALVLHQLWTVFVAAKGVLLSLMCVTCAWRVDPSSTPLRVPFLMALVSTAADSRGNSFSGDDGSSWEVLIAMAFELVVHSNARWSGGRLSACALMSLHSRVRSWISSSNIRPSISQVMCPWPHVLHTEHFVTLGFRHRFRIRWLLSWVLQHPSSQLVLWYCLCYL